MSVPEYLETDRGRIHPLTRPVLVEGAQPGAVVARHLPLSQVGNEPMFTVSAAIAKSVLTAGTLF